MLSIIVAVYNAESYLERCINSIINQTYQDWELILVNDGSTDRSLKLCQQYAQKDNRIRVFSQKNRGPAAARNVGLRNARGDIWTTLDSDDWIEKDTYELAISNMEKHQAEMVIYGFQYTDGKRIWKTESDRLRQGLYLDEECRKFFLDFLYRKGNKINPFVWLRVMKMDLVKKNNIYFDEELKRSEDFYFLSWIHQKVKRIFVMTQEEKVFYFQNKSSITHSYIKDYWRMVKKVYSQLWTKAESDVEMERRVEYMLLYRARIAIQNEIRSEKNFFEKYKQIKSIMNDKLLKEKNSKLSIRRYIEEFGKKNVLIKLRMAFIYMILNP